MIKRCARKGLAIAGVVSVLIALPLAADEPTASTIEREGDRDAVTLDSGAYAKVYVPSTVPKGHAPGMVIALHGMGGTPDTILDWGMEVAGLRSEVWCAVRGSTEMSRGYGWDIPKDIQTVAAMTRFAVGHYGIDPKRVVIQGFSAGGALSMYTATQNKTLYAGWIACAARGWPGPPGANPEGLRAVVFLGTDDPVYQSVGAARDGIAHAGKGFTLRIVEGLAHSLPEDVYFLAALRYVYDPSASDAELTLPALPTAKLVPPGGAYSQAFVPLKGADIVRTKPQAKALAAKLVAQLRAPNAELDTIVSEAGPGITGGTVLLDGFGVFGTRAMEKAKTLKSGSWEIIETEAGCLVASRQRK